jgi:hypothetical protein
METHCLAKMSWKTKNVGVCWKRHQKASLRIGKHPPASCLSDHKVFHGSVGAKRMRRSEHGVAGRRIRSEGRLVRARLPLHLLSAHDPGHGHREYLVIELYCLVKLLVIQGSPNYIRESTILRMVWAISKLADNSPDTISKVQVSTCLSVFWKLSKLGLIDQ